MTSDPVQRTQKISIQAGTSGQTQASEAQEGASRPWTWKLLLGFGGILVLGGAVFLLSSRGPEARVPKPQGEASKVGTPDAIRAYLDQAQTGDVHAMRMLGVMYYYGLNVPQDREEGLRWYRQAAEKGSDAAREDLARLQVGAAK
ncbi:tetratricopeptide repeat protein [Geothrix fuzhouensis]|uniref:tetratricopeptide repeat protein n=1 Tax=Geothrix fuzhouensis TaxID=2966451 RepID=UPI0021492CD3|nr:SEL1-like repeat protein [Geothrix fuzhouensis]